MRKMSTVYLDIFQGEQCEVLEVLAAKEISSGLNNVLTTVVNVANYKKLKLQVFLI